MTKLTSYGEVKSSDDQKLSLDNSVEIDEEAVGDRELCRLNNAA